jgi:hypothetical protein
MIVTDIHLWFDLGMPGYAVDVLVVLQQFLSDYPEARLEQNSNESPVTTFNPEKREPSAGARR